MPIIAVECIHCGAKLKVKAGASRTPPAIKCPKCAKQIPLSPRPAAAPQAPQPDAAVPPPPDAAILPPPLPEDEEPPTAAEPPPEEEVPPPPADEPPQAPPVPPPMPDPIPEPVEPEPVQAPEEETITPPAVTAPPPAPPSTTRKAAAPIVISSLGEHPSAVWVDIRCPSCHWQSRVREEIVGKKVQCKQCGGVIAVEKPQAAPIRLSTVRLPAQTPAPVPTPVVPLRAAAPAVPQPSHSQPVSAALPAVVPTPVPAEGVSARAQLAELQGRLAAAENRLVEAERRALVAENALHELDASKALENVKASRRIAELEARLAEMQKIVGEMASDDQSELAHIEQRMTILHHRLSRLGLT